MSDGSYSWVMPQASDYGLGYLSSFYDAGLSFPKIETVGSAYKRLQTIVSPRGGSRRIMGQQCGQTWLQTFSEVNNIYNGAKQLPYLQLVTWNDYEEATELESGIDSCFSLTASVSGSALQWSVNGNEYGGSLQRVHQHRRAKSDDTDATASRSPRCRSLQLFDPS